MRKQLSGCGSGLSSSEDLTRAGGGDDQTQSIAKPGPLLVFVNKVLLKHSFSRLHIAYAGFCTTEAEMSSFDRDCMAHMPQIFTVRLFTEKVHQPLD